MTGLYLEDLSLDQSAERVWTVTDAVIKAFAEVSGDHNPLHLDEAFAETTAFKGRIAHGMLAASYISAVIGMQLPGPGTIYLSQALKFRRPVRIGDEVSVSVRVIAIDPDKAHVTLATLAQVAGKTVVDGEAVVMVSRRSA
ncbi:MAG: MaoC family dehydratase [Caulobacteraceae bacterium]|nr:MaoC family dehydratase [Caulobacteraceae bacterium]